ncbi:hypothetical protein [Virgisporangium aurantiacum]|uniref:Uncharacterized protein n=1 Tax=Virgisporangium aurantiacum TaxID=175570 RepID=A0A8J3ZIQ1_9ACTN|nr:hypothetical protein [Virgisporangium aurantiacum]GIJ62123.1 hypothetical protein Vau01_096390 [Virgisporangium aurantiacum]
MTPAVDRLRNDAGREEDPPIRDGAPQGPTTALDAGAPADQCDTVCKLLGCRLADAFDDDPDLHWLSGGGI